MCVQDRGVFKGIIINRLNQTTPPSLTWLASSFSPLSLLSFRLSMASSFFLSLASFFSVGSGMDSRFWGNHDWFGTGYMHLDMQFGAGDKITFVSIAMLLC